MMLKVQYLICAFRAIWADLFFRVVNLIHWSCNVRTQVCTTWAVRYAAIPGVKTAFWGTESLFTAKAIRYSFVIWTVSSTGARHADLGRTKYHPFITRNIAVVLSMGALKECWIHEPFFSRKVGTFSGSCLKIIQCRIFVFCGSKIRRITFILRVPFVYKVHPTCPTCP